MKGMLQVFGVRDIKSIHGIGARSIPKIQRSDYLELYMLRREKDRLEKEAFTLDKRRNSVMKQINSITQRIENLQKETQQKKEIKSYGNITTKPLKTMPINY